MDSLDASYSLTCFALLTGILSKTEPHRKDCVTLLLFWGSLTLDASVRTCFPSWWNLENGKKVKVPLIALVGCGE